MRTLFRCKERRTAREKRAKEKAGSPSLFLLFLPLASRRSPFFMRSTDRESLEQSNVHDTWVFTLAFSGETPKSVKEKKTTITSCTIPMQYLFKENRLTVKDLQSRIVKKLSC